MKKQFIIFFTIVLSVYGVINFYILFKAWHAFALLHEQRFLIVTAGAILAALYPLGRVLERYTLSRVNEIVVYLGAVWLAEMVYLFLFTASFDIITAFIYLISLPFPVISEPSSEITMWIEIGIISFSTLITIVGFWNARFPHIKELQFSIPKKSSAANIMKIAAVSDIHLGTIMGPKRLRYIVDKINSLHADVVLLVGDVFDEDIGRVIKNNLGDLLRQMESTYGTYAITGNHEFFGGVYMAVSYLEDHGIKVLRDESVTINNSVNITGRNDLSYNAGGSRKRKSLNDILEHVSRDLPVIVLDHQPTNLLEAVDAGVDVQLSGHTHHGQLFPFNLITKRVYEISWGYKKKGNTNFYVSCGVGSWGPPVRTGNTPEILSITLRFV
jgi:uncharacterized protein